MTANAKLENNPKPADLNRSRDISASTFRAMSGSAFAEEGGAETGAMSALWGTADFG
jgi:hypothetical protein